jgi:hypothetical protein
MVSNVAKLPIAPQFVGDLAFIDIASLMKGNTVYFQLPSQNKTWLEENNWIDDTSDLDTSVYYVTKMYVQLLPRYAKYATEEASVAIIVSSSGVSQLGPALKNKTFIIPERSYVTKYDQMPSEEISDTCLLPPYSACDDRIPVYCKRSDGSSNAQDVSLNPSLFSQWSMTATFDDNPENLGVIRYRSLATNPYVYVQYEMIKFSLAEDSSRRLRSSKSHQDLQQRRALRAQQETNNNICCPNGEYRTRVDGENVCVACPDKSISQLGGLYCMYPIFNLTTLTPSSISL